MLPLTPLPAMRCSPGSLMSSNISNTSHTGDSPFFLKGVGGRGMGRRGVGRCCRMRVTALLSVPASLMEDGWADSLALVVIDWCTAPCRCPAGSGGVWNHCVSLANHPLTSCCPAGQANDSHVYTGTCLLSSLSSSPASL